MTDRTLGWTAALMAALIPLIHTLIAIMRNDGHFAYALDDPYIHLDLAKQIALTGIYGLNPGEWSAPSSSILWPFLLAPFAYSSLFDYVPLALGIVCSGASAAIICSLLPEKWRALHRLGLSVLAIIALNLPGLALMGMEHGLHIVLSLLAARGCLEVMNGKPPRFWLYAVLIAHPLLRYEGMLITLATSLVLFFSGYRRQAAGVVLVAASALMAFSGFLYLHGLGLLPGSASTKKLMIEAPDGQFMKFLSLSIFIALRNPATIVLLAGSLIAPIVFIYAAIKRNRRLALLTATLSVALIGQILVGRFSVFEIPRYDYYTFAFIVPLIAAPLWKMATLTVTRTLLVLLTLAISSAGFWCSVWDIQRASAAIYQQQYQMGRLVREFWHEDIAANDIGAVGLNTNAYVLDLIGLANSKARQMRLGLEPLWADKLVREYHSPLVMVYQTWIEPDNLAQWTELGRVTRQAPTVMGDASVLFFTPYPERAEEIRAVLRAWAKDLPATSRYTESVAPSAQ